MKRVTGITVFDKHMAKHFYRAAWNADAV